MPVPFSSASVCPDLDSDSCSEELYFDASGVQCEVMRGEPMGREGEQDGVINCGKCDLNFMTDNALHRHMRDGNGEGDARKHYYCVKCRVDFDDEEGLKGHKMESSEHMVCDECSREFDVLGALEFHQAVYMCPGCGDPFSAIFAIVRHIESDRCKGWLSAAGLDIHIKKENTPLAMKDLPAGILAGTTSTHTWHPDIMPQRVTSALRRTPDGSKTEEPVPKDFFTVLDYTIPDLPDSPQSENLEGCWNESFGSYFCPILRCGKKFHSISELEKHLVSLAHLKKAFRCPKCFARFRSASSLIQNGESDACGIKGSHNYERFINAATGGLITGDGKAGFDTDW
ncbi:hypothetical protein HOY82DRAFT_645746 [Tuber indicum]|nr:hypothetical protein HOY82DRAFT_645746 [Tuber indicum]